MKSCLVPASKEEEDSVHFLLQAKSVKSPRSNKANTLTPSEGVILSRSQREKKIACLGIVKLRVLSRWTPQFYLFD